MKTGKSIIKSIIEKSLMTDEQADPTQFNRWFCGEHG